MKPTVERDVGQHLFGPSRRMVGGPMRGMLRESARGRCHDGQANQHLAAAVYRSVRLLEMRSWRPQSRDCFHTLGMRRFPKNCLLESLKLRLLCLVAINYGPAITSDASTRLGASTMCRNSDASRLSGSS